ncbi:hypothetical protein DRQ09_09375 [candidate division KSB1 bacterium]|nr:MAG: hypothetical protein DRQ09_09375 [candidate division KSB1 bacterium]
MKIKSIFIIILILSGISSTVSGQLYVGSMGGGIYISENFGKSWSIFTLPPYCINNFKFNPYVDDEILYCCTYDGLWKVSVQKPEKPVLLTGPNVIFVNDICFDSENPETFFIAGMNGIFKTINNGKNWIELNINSPVKYTTVIRYSKKILLAGKEDGIYISTNDGNSWERRLPHKPIRCILSVKGKLIAGTEDFGIYISDDDGKTWKSGNKGLNHHSVYSLARDPENGIIFAGTYQGGIYKSLDYGKTWKQFENNLSTETILGIAVYDGNIFASCFWKGLFRSTDDGLSFRYIGFASKENYGISTILINRR